MSADFMTTIRFRKLPENIEDILMFINKLETSDNNIYFLGQGKESLMANNTLCLSGPYGRFAFLSDTGIFEKIAGISPKAEWDGEMSGFTSGDEQMLRAEFSNGILKLKFWSRANEYLPEQYVEFVKEICPWDSFCELFKLSADNIEDDYDEFISETVAYESLEDLDYDDFTSVFETKISENQFFDSLYGFIALEIPDFDTFCEMQNDKDNWNSEWEFRV